MKKLKLRALDFGAKELLSREQMKKVLGGIGSGSGGSGGCEYKACTPSNEASDCTGYCYRCESVSPTTYACFHPAD